MSAVYDEPGIVIEVDMVVVGARGEPSCLSGDENNLSRGWGLWASCCRSSGLVENLKSRRRRAERWARVTRREFQAAKFGWPGDGSRHGHETITSG